MRKWADVTMEYKLFKTNGLNEIQSDISFVFYRMIHSGANEIFSDWPFVMLEIRGGWQENSLV